MEPDQRTQLITENSGQNAIVDENDLDDILPPSSRVKKILKWNKETSRFEMEPTHERELREQHIKDATQWAEFEKFFSLLNPNDHPSKRRKSCPKAFLYGTIATIFMLALIYVCFIILQLALFNLIMLVVMSVWLYKAG